MNRSLLTLAALLASSGPAAAAALPLPAAPAGLTNIGIAAAVRGAIRAQAPGQTVGRDVTSGKPVFLNDHVTTGPGARMQILLLDETTFTIGPNSDMLLDEFVYDPATGAGKVSAQITKGVFRFVTGKVAQRNPSDMKVKLPVGTIGIRGTMVEGSVNGQDADILLTGPGAQNNAQERPGGITVTNAGGSTDIDASGYGTTIRGGGAPSAGFRFTPEQVGAIHGQLSGPANGASNGGGGTANQTAANAPAGTGSASQQSGQTTAAGGENFTTTASNLSSQSNDTSNFAAQQTQAAGSDISTWDEILAIPSGSGSYAMSGSWTGVSGTAGPGITPASTGISGTFGATMTVDFGTHQLSGNVSMSGGINDSNSFFVSDFKQQIGTPAPGSPATLPLAAGFDGGAFSGSSVEFRKVDGDPAGGAVFNLVYDNGFNKASGTSDVAPRGPGNQFR